ncbi:MAG TPA: CHAT domain-containing protein [Candidatus Krumholzibacteria bacterium]|nr:CHAT domain-containing protein [Candidatus Krumholzibacteria bacterium]
MTSFITVADSLARTQGDAALEAFVADNSALVGSSVAQLLDVAFQLSQAKETAAAAKENVDFARKIAAAHEARGGSKVARGLCDRYEKWTASQRASRTKAMALEAQSVEARKANDIPKAVSLLDQARAIYQRIGDQHSIAVNWGTMGVTHFAAADWDNVIKDYDEALVARRAVEDRILEGRTLNGLGSAYQQRGDYAKSIEYYQQAIALREKTGDLGGLATSITYLGNTYNRSGRYVQARECYEKALPILEAQGNAQQMVEMQSGVAALNASMGRLKDAEEAYLRGIEIATGAGLTDSEASLRRNLADNLFLQGRYSEALEHLDQTLQLIEARGTAGAQTTVIDMVTEQALTLSTRGTTYMYMGEVDKARDDFVKFAELAKTMENPQYAALAQRSIAEFYGEIGAYERGLKAVDEAVALSEKAGDARGYREAVAVRGRLQTRLGRHEEALKAWEEALAQDTQDQASRHILDDEVAIASCKASLGQTEAARVQLRTITPRAREAGLPHVETAVKFAMGHSFERENADSAAFYYDRALADHEKRGVELGASQMRGGYLSGVSRLYYEEVTRFYADTYASTGDARWSKRAFTTIEKAKARGLLDLMQATIGERASPQEEELLDRLYSLDPAAAGYASEREKIERQYTEMRRARVHSELGGLSNASAVVGLDAVARLLPEKAVLLEYALGDSASFLWVIDRDGSELVKLPARSQIDAQVRRLRDALSRVDGDRTALLTSARSVYQLLVAPAEARLAKAKSAVIVPDGVVFELPFEVLLTAEPSKDGWNKQPFLTRKLTTLYAPSASVYASLKASTRTAEYPRDLLAVGNPDFTTLAAREDDPLAPLPFASQEVEAVSSRIKDERKLVLTGKAACEGTVKRELKNGAPRVVHLATHGLVDPNEPERSSVVLAADDRDDGYFHTLEILATPTHSRLVVMSACESARGKVSRGEGVVGLSRAFLASGAGSVVASLWAVSDESTAELMKQFYDRMLGKKQPASRALNEARLALIKNDKYAHPFYWSPFVVTGTESAPW